MLIEQQDRTLWDHRLIAMGLVCLEWSAQGQTISRYHVEANIAAEHCLSASFEKTAWHKIVASYQLLERIAPSPLHFLNRVIVTAEWQSADSALALLLCNFSFTSYKVFYRMINASVSIVHFISRHAIG